MVTFKNLLSQTNYFYFQINFISGLSFLDLILWLHFNLIEDITLLEHLIIFGNIEG